MTRLKTEFIKLDDIRMAYWQHGKGENLIFLHGNSGSKAFFKQYLLDHFPMFHCYAIDSRGHGQSRSKDEQLSYEQQSEDILHFCQTKGIQNASVVGYSDGGNLALWLAIKDPERFDKIVAISPNTVASATTERSMNAIRKFIDTMTFWKRLGMPLKKQIMRFQLMLTDTGITDEDLKKISSKILLIYAEKDMIVEDHFLHIAELIPSIKLIKMNGCTHLSTPLQAETISHIRDFLSR